MSLLAQLLPKKETKEYFLTLCITDHTVRAAVANIVDAAITVLGTGESTITPERTLLAAADEAITHAEKPLPSGTMVKTVVFALPQHYLEEDRVKPEHLEAIKTISKELDLSPRGFIEYPSAISFYLEKEEGSPPTLLLIALEGSHITFSLLRLGKVQQQVQVAATDSFTADFATALAQLTAEILPSRILLFDSGLPLTRLREELLKFPWHKHAQFIHTPKVEIFAQTHVLAALIEAGASSFLRNLPQEPELTTPIPATTHHEKSPATIQPPLTEHHSHHTLQEPEEKMPESTEAAITHDLQQFAHKVLQNAEETFGFVKEPVDVDEPEEKVLPEPHHDHHLHHQQHAHHTEAVTEDEDEPQTSPRSDWKKRLAVPAGFRGKLPSFSWRPPKLPVGGTGLWIIIPIVLFLTGAGWLVWSVPKATVSIGVYPFSTSQSMDVVFATTTDQSSGDKTLLVREVSQEVNGTKTAPSTGTGKVGDKAKGSVTIYNKTTNSKTLPKGSVLQNGDLRFTMDDDVTVASSSDTGEGLSFGKANANVTAQAIGPDSNIGGGSVFTFKDFPDSSYTAKSSQSFKGGASRDVVSVSKADQTKIEDALMKELSDQAKQQLSQSLNAGEKLLDGTVQLEVGTKKFSADPGSEAKEVTLTLSLRAKGRVYQEDELQQLAKNTFTALPSGYAQAPRTITSVVEKITMEKDGTNHATIRTTAYFLPEINTADIQQHLVGKTFAQAQAYGATLPTIAGMKISQERSLPLLTNRLPLRRQSIIIQTVTY